MRMNLIPIALLTLGLALGAEPLVAQAESWEPTRVNKIIELWEADQPVYYTQTEEYGYEECQAMADTPADYISLNMEHGYIDIRALRDCMRGLVDAGPTASGHRTPAVIAVLPAWGWSNHAMEANAYLAQQIMGSGVHGMLLTHAVDPDAVRTMIEAIRYPRAPDVPGIDEGRQGQGSQGFPASIWGVSQNQYMDLADPWPMNPNGEVVLGLKVENRFGQDRVEELVRIPGIAFVEHGPGDTEVFLEGRFGANNVPEDIQEEIHHRVWEAARDAGIYFLQDCNNLTVIDEGTRVCTNLGSAERGRVERGRQMPW